MSMIDWINVVIGVFGIAVGSYDIGIDRNYAGVYLILLGLLNIYLGVAYRGNRNRQA